MEVEEENYREQECRNYALELCYRRISEYWNRSEWKSWERWTDLKCFLKRGGGTIWTGDLGKQGGFEK